MTRSQQLLCISALALVAAGAPAASRSPLGESDLQGRWEAVAEDEPRVFVMSIAGSGRSRIVMVAGVPPDPDAWTFQVRTKRVGKDGNVYIEAQDADGTVLKVRGQGKGKRGAAHITAEVELWGAKEYGPSTFRAVFHSRSSGYLAALKSLISKAESRLPESR